MSDDTMNPMVGETPQEGTIPTEAPMGAPEETPADAPQGDAPVEPAM